MRGGLRPERTGGTRASGEQPGLRLRLAHEARRLFAQHRWLEALLALVAETLERREAEQARECFLRFKDALEAHMALEEEFFFPALPGLYPELTAELTALARDHLHLRGQLGRLARRFARASLGSRARGLARFEVLLTEHERREERLPLPRPPGPA
jgi:hypothetical protein